MAIADTIKSMQTHTQNAYTKIGEKGGVIPANKNLENLSSSIESISAGGFAPEYVKFGNYTGSALTLKGLDTSKIIDMSGMFSDCSGLTSLDLSSFDTSKVTIMNNMFQGCSSLTALDISNFDFSKVTSYDNMFTSVPDNCEILIKDETAKTWITSKFTNLTNVKVKV